MVPIKNMTVVSREVVNPASNYQLKEESFGANVSCQVCKNGWHNVTVLF
jgi:hypothetical protein